MAESSAIDQALVAMLGSDTALLSSMPHGVYWAGDTPEWAKAFVEVSVADTEDLWVFGLRAIESALYCVKAVMLSTAGSKAAIVAAETRIDALLDGQTLGIGSPLSVDGYTYMSMVLETRFPPEAERDAQDASILWWHRGGYYRVEMSVTDEP